LYFFLSLQSALSLFRICSYNFFFLSVNLESKAKLSSFSREHLALSFEEELLYFQSLGERRFLSLQTCWLLMVMVGLQTFERKWKDCGGHQCLAVGFGGS
jgi:hypothetical protein